jgi:hypothetical protein
MELKLYVLNSKLKVYIYFFLRKLKVDRIEFHKQFFLSLSLNSVMSIFWEIFVKKEIIDYPNKFKEPNHVSSNLKLNFKDSEFLVKKLNMSMRYYFIQNKESFILVRMCSMGYPYWFTFKFNDFFRDLIIISCV